MNKKQIKQSIAKAERESFHVASICRADLESLGYDTTKLDDAMMAVLAERLGEHYSENFLRDALEEVAEEFELSKQTTAMPAA